jgi:dTDP-4-amino-4,6-dideoxygalactose transaminase
VDVGSSYLPSEALAAILFAQLEAREKIQARRGEIWHRYNRELKDWAERNQVRLPVIPEYSDQPYHMFYMLLPDLQTRTRFIQTLRDKGIYSVFHYLPLHLSDMGLKFGGKVGDCPVTEDISDRLVRLPLFFNLEEKDQDYVIETITQINL